MVLQRDRPLPIWGWADPGEEVTVKLDEATATAKADAQGNWKVVLPAVKADGKAHRMTVSGKNKIELDDILIGEVWIGSGQSNMEFGLAGSIGGKEAVAAANYPQIRLLHVEKVQAPQPAKDIVVAGGARGKARPARPDRPGLEGLHPAERARLLRRALLLRPAAAQRPRRARGPDQLFLGRLAHRALDRSPGKKGGGMYNGMIAPLEPFAIRGTIWYQGETNVMQTAAEVSRQDEGPDRGLAAGLGLRFPLLLRPDRALARATQPGACPPSGKPRWPA